MKIVCCGKCGKLIPENSLVCQYCGVRVEDVPTKEAPPEAQKPEKEKKKNPRWLIAPAVLVVIALLALCLWQPLSGLFMRLAPTEDYFRFLAKNDAGSIVKISSMLSDAGLWRQTGLTGKASFTVGDGFKQFLSGQLGLKENDWINKLSLSFAGENVGQRSARELELSVNGHPVTGGTLLLDREEKTLTASLSALTGPGLGADFSTPAPTARPFFPQRIDGDFVLPDYDPSVENAVSFRKTAVKVPARPAVFEEEKNDLSSLERLLPLLPEAEERAALLTRYLEMAIGHVETVEKSEGTLSIGGIEQPCTTYTALFDRTAALATLNEWAEAIPEDEQLLRALDTVFDGMDADVTTETLCEELRSREFTDADVADFQELTLCLFVDGGRVIGRTVTGEDFAFTASMAEQNGDKGFELSLTLDGSECFRLSGTGRGTKLTGEAELTVSGSKAAALTMEKLDLSSLQKGKLSGTVSVTLDPSRKPEDKRLAALCACTLTAELDASRGKTKAKLTLSDGDALWLKGTFSESVDSVEDVETPSRTLPAAAWRKQCDLTPLTEALSAAGAPEGFNDSLQKLIKGE